MSTIHHAEIRIQTPQKPSFVILVQVVSGCVAVNMWTHTPKQLRILTAEVVCQLYSAVRMQTQYIALMLGQSWNSGVDGGLIVCQHCVNILCFLGFMALECFYLPCLCISHQISQSLWNRTTKPSQYVHPNLLKSYNQAISNRTTKPSKVVQPRPLNSCNQDLTNYHTTTPSQIVQPSHFKSCKPSI